jgi:hypothetical protein
MPFISNLQTVSTVCRRLSFQSQHDVVGYGRKVAERSEKATSVPETKKNEPPIKLVDDSKIPTTRSP